MTIIRYFTTPLYTNVHTIYPVLLLVKMYLSLLVFERANNNNNSKHPVCSVMTKVSYIKDER